MRLFGKEIDILFLDLNLIYLFTFYHRTKKDRDHPTENVVLSIGSQMTMKDSRFELKINNATASYLLQVSYSDSI